MVNNEALDALRVPIEPQHFYEKINRDIFEAILDLRKAGTANPVTVRNHVDEVRIGECGRGSSRRAETLAASPAALGPRMSQGAFSEMVSAVISTEYDRAPRIAGLPQPARLAASKRRGAGSTAILRRRIASWSTITDIKSRKGMFFDRHLEKNDMVRRTFERRINGGCQTIASSSNRKDLVQFDIPLGRMSQNSIIHTSTTVSSDKRDQCPAYWIAPDARPQIDP